MKEWAAINLDTSTAFQALDAASEIDRYTERWALIAGWTERDAYYSYVCSILEIIDFEQKEPIYRVF